MSVQHPIGHHPTVHARAGEMSLSFTREFDAPAALVFRAHVEADLFVRWMGPRGTTCDIERFDATTGGAFRYTIVAGDARFTFFGSYHEVTAPSRIVHTWEFAAEAGRPTFESLMFVDLSGDRCRVDGLSVYGSAEQCAEMLAADETGEGMDENFERLDDLLDGLRADPAHLYATVRARIGERLRAAGSTADDVRVPACPDWTVAQLVAHLAGTTAALVAHDLPAGDAQSWVDAHVAARAGRSALENWHEWDAVGPAFEAMLVAKQASGSLVYDAIVHEGDLDAALGFVATRDAAALGYALGRLAATLGRVARERGLGTLRVVGVGGEPIDIGIGEPVVTWQVADAWTALRALGSRRSAAQLAALGFTGDLVPWTKVLPSELPTTDLVEH